MPIRIDVTQAEYFTGVSSPEGLEKFQEELGGQPQFVFSGRSNCGKSSLLNALLGRKNLAHTSSKPGHTQQINAYQIEFKCDDEKRPMIFVDLPGYGFAKVSKKEKLHWQELIESYFQSDGNMKSVFVLADCRRGFAVEEEQLVDFLRSMGKVECVAAFTKADKLKNQKEKATAKKEADEVAALGNMDTFLTSVTKNQGIYELREKIWNSI